MCGGTRYDVNIGDTSNINNTHGDDSESEDVENVFDETSKFMEQDAFSDSKGSSHYKDIEL